MVRILLHDLVDSFDTVQELFQYCETQGIYLQIEEIKAEEIVIVKAKKDFALIRYLGSMTVNDTIREEEFIHVYGSSHSYKIQDFMPY